MGDFILGLALRGSGLVGIHSPPLGDGGWETIIQQSKELIETMRIKRRGNRGGHIELES